MNRPGGEKNTAEDLVSNPSLLLPLVGRDSQMQRLKGWLMRAMSLVRQPHSSGPMWPPYEGRLFPQLMLVLGEMGAGKTRFASEAVRLARSMGYFLAWTTCRETEAATPYFPLREMLDMLFRRLSHTQMHILLAEAGINDTRLEPLLPALIHHFPRLAPARPVQSLHEERLRLWDAVALLLEAFQRKLGNILLVFDDIHWADQETISVLNHIQYRWQPIPIGGEFSGVLYTTVPELPIRNSAPILITAHSGLLQANPTLRTWAARLERVHFLKRLWLPALGKADVTTLARHICGTNASDRHVETLAHQVFSHGLGNPFFTIEFLRQHTHSDDSSVSGYPPESTRLGHSEQPAKAIEHGALPELIAASLEERLMRVSSECREWLATAAIQGDEFDLAAMQRLWDGPIADDSTAGFHSASGKRTNSGRLMKEALAAALIYESLISDGRERHSMSARNAEKERRYRFWHPLLARYIRQTLPEPYLAWLQRRAAALLLSPQGIRQSYPEETPPSLSSTSRSRNIFPPDSEPSAHHTDSAKQRTSGWETEALSRLTTREREILSLIALGNSTADIAQTLYLSNATVRTHIRNLLSKLGVSSRLQAVLLWKEYIRQEAEQI